MSLRPRHETALINELRQISLKFGEPFCSRKVELLTITTGLTIHKAKEILLYHDTLLCLLAWPENKVIFHRTVSAMKKLIADTKKNMLINKNLEAELDGTGIAGTELTGRFSYAIARWLVHEFYTDTELHSSLAYPETIKSFFRQLIPAVEYENVSVGELNLLQRIKKLKGSNKVTAIGWLIHLLEAAQLPYQTKEFLFNELRPFINWKLNHHLFNRSSLTLTTKKIAFQQSVAPPTEILKTITAKLPLPSRLTRKQKKQLVSIARATLIFMYRETEPFSYADEKEVQLFELENGISIALYSMIKEQRLSIESYVGYLLFKNGIPVAYGGGWIFGERCQFGINILPPFRNGESSYFFSQLLRVYHKYYGIKSFVIKPYQFGKNNTEALKSGAFWFYYKHGFRSDKEELQALAIQESEKKRKDSKYRTPVSLMKKFTGATLSLNLSKKTIPLFDAAIVSQAITDFINKEYNGNRNAALLACVKKSKKELPSKALAGWNQYEKKVWQHWSLLVQTFLSVSKWSPFAKKELVDLIKAKGGSKETSFIKRLQKHRQFWKALTNKVK